MTHSEAKRVRASGGISAEEFRKALEEETLALAPVSEEALQAAFTLIGNEIARRRAMAQRAGDETLARRLVAGLGTLKFTQSALDDDILLNDFLRYADDLRDELDLLPDPDPDDDDAWILKSDVSDESDANTDG